MLLLRCDRQTLSLVSIYSGNRCRSTHCQHVRASGTDPLAVPKWQDSESIQDPAQSGELGTSKATNTVDALDHSCRVGASDHPTRPVDCGIDVPSNAFVRFEHGREDGATVRVAHSPLAHRLFDRRRFYNVILLPRIRDDIEEYKKLNFHLYMVKPLTLRVSNNTRFSLICRR